MRYKKIMILTLILTCLFVISTVSATDNTTDDSVSTDNVIDGIGVVDNTETEVIAIEENTSIISGNDYGNGESPFVPVDEYGRPIKIDDDYADDQNNVGTNFNIKNDIFITPSFTKHYTEDASYILKCNWKGYFEGHFKVFKGNSCIFNKHVKGYDKKYVWDSTFNWNVGTYNAYLYDNNGNKISFQKYVIKKAQTKISIKKFFSVKPGKKIKITALIHHTNYYIIFNKLTVFVKINGKTYNCKNDIGDRKVLIKAPNKIKTYTGKIIVPGTKNLIGSSKTFKLVVSKTIMGDSKITTKSKITLSPNAKYALTVNVKYANGKKITSGNVKVSINGKTYSARISKGVAKVNIKAPSNAGTYKATVSYCGNKQSFPSSASLKVIVKAKQKIVFSVPVKFDKYSYQTIGEYTFRTYKYVEYDLNGRNAHVYVTLFKNDKKLTKDKYDATYYLHFQSGYWKTYVQSYDDHTLTIDEVLDIDYIEAVIIL